MSDVITGINSMNAFGGSAASYSFAIYKGEAPAEPLSEDAPTQMTLVLNPTSIEQDEPFSQAVTPTLGGLNVETRGQHVRTITLSGTTGFLPKPERAGGGGLLSPLTTLFGPSDQELADISGYAEFMRLRNMFRLYSKIKKGEVSVYSRPSVRNSVIMLFNNSKDNEIWVVEPVSFTMPARRKFMYNYSIRLSALAPFSGDWLRGPSSSLSLFGKILRAIRDVKNVISAIQSGINRFTAGVMTLANQILEPLNIIADGLSVISQGLNVPFQLTQDLLNTTAAALRNFSSALHPLVDTGNMVFSGQASPELTATILSAQGSLSSVATCSELFHPTPQQDHAQLLSYVDDYGSPVTQQDSGNQRGFRYETVWAGENIFSLAKRLLGDSQRFMELITLNSLVPPYVVADVSNRGPGLLGPGDPVMVPADAPAQGQQSLSSTDSGAMILSDAYSPSVADTALVFNTDSNGDLVVTNSGFDWIVGQFVGQLMDVTDAAGVTRTGPVKANGKFTITGPSASGLTAPLTWKVYLPGKSSQPKVSKLGTERAYGVDLTLTSDGGLALDGSGDIAITSGMDNLNSALDVKLRTELGQLPMHTWFGLPPTVGVKGTQRSVLTVSAAFVATALSDPRVSSVDNLKVVLVKDRLDISARIRIRTDNTVLAFTRSL